MGGRRMTLPFSTTWPERMGEFAGQPNYFVPKIWKSLLNGVWMNAYDFSEKFKTLSDEDAKKINEVKSKSHTIRKDESNRWKPDMDIHFVINNRTKDRFQFVPVIKCVSVQKIEIVWRDGGLIPGRTANVFIDNTKEIGRYNEKDKIWRDRVKVDRSLEALAINDGFESVEDFFSYFNTDFTGKIIHWTDLKY